MTRDTKTLSAVFMAVLLILASGTAVSLAVTSSSAPDAGTNAVGMQETTTATDGAEQTTRAADEQAQQDQASVTFNQQASGGEQIVIESATLPEGGFIAIHDATYEDAPLASVLGNSVYLEPGTHENVTITLARPIAETQTLVAMPHLDTNENQVYDFVLSTGELDGPYTADNQTVVDEANVTVEQETTTTTEAAEETTTTEAVEETTTEAVEETTTTEEAEETTTEAVEETTTEAVEETTTTEEAEETTTTEAADGVEETTTEVVEQTTTQPAADADETQRLVFQIEQMNIERWSFVIGDEETPDRTQTVGNLTVQDRRVVINLTRILQQSAAAQQQAPPMTTQSPEQVEQMIEQNLTQDFQTVRFVIQNVQVENVTFVVIAPENVEIPEPPMMTTTPAEPGEETTTEEVEETTTTEEVEETTTEAVEETTTTEEADGVEETTTTEEVEETTTEAVEETTTTEEVEETTTEAAQETTTTAAADLQSFEVSNLDAPQNATAGDTIEVSATVSNPNDQQATQEVVFRLQGTVIARQTVTLDAGEQTTVTFEIDTEGVPAGQYIHGVYTRDFGELDVIVIEEPSAETTAAGTETPEATETPADGETTQVVEETTTTAQA
ncbi:DUF7282 domain-containing protein [Halorussus sp. AFM4]|uniref:DUF7282 domain-containing protein n=1 Tax=Halorussus sp. AFM4 TaxID=3421651 RepID=UPI003EBCEB58